MRSFIEFLLAAGLALSFHFGLRLEHEAYLLFGIGLLLTLAVHLILDRFNGVHYQLQGVLGRVNRFESILEGLKDPEAILKGRALLETTHNVLKLLRDGSIPLTEAEYYYEASRCLDRCKKEIRAVNSVDITDWLGKVQKQNYYRDQVKTRNRGVGIARIFVIRRVDLEKPDVVQTVIHQQKDGIHVRLALHEDLAFSGIEGIEMPTNFVLFDSDTLIARTPFLGVYYGKKSHAAVEISRYTRVYEILDQHARPPGEIVPQIKAAQDLQKGDQL